MAGDFLLVAALICAAFTVTGLLYAWAEGVAPRRAAVMGTLALLCLGGAWYFLRETLTPAYVPVAFIAVVDAVLD